MEKRSSCKRYLKWLARSGISITDGDSALATSKTPTQPTSSTAAKQILAEEVRELREAVDEDDTAAVCNEAADVLFVAIGHIEALGTQGIDGVRYVTNKNANKTEQTHAIRPDTGKLLPKEGKPHKWE